MASASPQKRVVSSVFITLASPYRATVTQNAPTVRSPSTAPPVGPKSNSTQRNAPAAPSSAARVPMSPGPAPASPTKTFHPSSMPGTPPITAKSPRPTVPWKEGGHIALPVTGDNATEDILPPPPPPPPSLNTEFPADLGPPLPPPPLLEPLPTPPAMFLQQDTPIPTPQKTTSLEKQSERRPPPSGQGPNSQLPENLGVQKEEAVDPESRDLCGFCRKPIMLKEPAIEALNRTYHADCFQCRQCCLPLAGKLYYNKAGIPLCEDCYQASLEQCWACGEAIKDQVIRALERAYHPSCFVCATCRRPIGEERFAQGEVGDVYCLADYYRKYAPQCSACLQLIVPGDDGKDSFTVECLGRSFHEDCYRCETCHVVLSPEPNEQGCYPLDGSLLCKACHLILVQGAQH